MFLLVLFCFFRRRQQVNNEVNKLSETYKSQARKPFVFFQSLPLGGVGGRPLYLRYRERIYNGFTTESQRSQPLLKRLELRGQWLELHFRSWPLIGKRNLNSSLFTLRSSLSYCKITTIFADVPTNYGKIHVRFEENALCARNTLIHSEKFSESILQTDKLS